MNGELELTDERRFLHGVVVFRYAVGASIFPTRA